MCQRVIIIVHVLNTFNGFWGYQNTELNFSMPDTPTVCYMSKFHRLAREMHKKQEGRKDGRTDRQTDSRSLLADHKAVLHKYNSSCTPRLVSG